MWRVRTLCRLVCPSTSKRETTRNTKSLLSSSLSTVLYTGHICLAPLVIPLPLSLPLPLPHAQPHSLTLSHILYRISSCRRGRGGNVCSSSRYADRNICLRISSAGVVALPASLLPRSHYLLSCSDLCGPLWSSVTLCPQPVHVTHSPTHPHPITSCECQRLDVFCPSVPSVVSDVAFAVSPPPPLPFSSRILFFIVPTSPPPHLRCCILSDCVHCHCSMPTNLPTFSAVVVFVPS